MSRVVIGSLSRLRAIILFVSVVGSVVPASFLGASPVAAASLIQQSATSTWGFSLRTQGPSEVQAWNHYATASDDVFSFSGTYASESNAGTKALIYNHSSGTTQSTIATAQQYGLATLIYNDEQIAYLKGAGCQTLISDSAAAASPIHQAGLKFGYAPTGWLTTKCYQKYPAFIQNADLFVFQAQALQGKDPNIVADVQGFVRAAKTIKPGIPVWVQLSVIPPNDHAVTVSSLASLITSLETGAPGSTPDSIIIFHDGSTMSMAMQVIATFRAYH